MLLPNDALINATRDNNKASLFAVCENKNEDIQYDCIGLCFKEDGLQSIEYENKEILFQSDLIWIGFIKIPIVINDKIASTVENCNYFRFL